MTITVKFNAFLFGQETARKIADLRQRTWGRETAEHGDISQDAEILTLELKVNEARQEEMEIDELLDFAENLSLNAASV